MKRECSLSEISDGRLYGLNDMVKADCDDCKGCSACCKGMGNSIILDPLDLCRLSVNLHKSFEQLLENEIELNVFQGIILPNLKMDEKTEKCMFLNEEGRCSIHAFRPGICRIFPLGRYYENNTFQYILQTNQCKKTNKTKIKVCKWIDTDNLKNNQKFISDWHYFIKDFQDAAENDFNPENLKKINMYILNEFFVNPYTDEEFYEEFYQRLQKAKDRLKLI